MKYSKNHYQQLLHVYPTNLGVIFEEVDLHSTVGEMHNL